MSELTPEYETCRRCGSQHLYLSLCGATEECRQDAARWSAEQDRIVRGKRATGTQNVSQRIEPTSPQLGRGSASIAAVLRALARQAEHNKHGTYWAQRWQHDEGDEIQAWLLSLIDAGWQPSAHDWEQG